MTYRLEGVFKDLADLPAKHYKQVVSKLLNLNINPFPHDSLALKGYEGVYRVDSGEYRITYRIDEGTVTIILIGKRNDDEVYRLLARKLLN